MVTKEVIKRRIDDRTVAIVKYPEEYENEYCVFELKNGDFDGIAQLFDDGILRMSWRMQKGEKNGKVCVYDSGSVVGVSSWQYLDGKEFRWIVNSKEGRWMEIVNTETNKRVYRGEYNGKLERDGYGVEYENGKVSVCGQWVKDSLIHMHQRVIDETLMIEYEGLNDDKNVDVLNHRPMYKGGYIYCEEENELKRHGFGHLIDSWGGVCMIESEWNEGIEIVEKRVEMKNGWFSEGESEESVREIVNGEHIGLCEELRVNDDIAVVDSESEKGTTINDEKRTEEPEREWNDEHLSESESTSEHVVLTTDSTACSVDSIDPIAESIVPTTEPSTTIAQDILQDTVTVSGEESEESEDEKKESTIAFSDDIPTDLSLEIEEMIIPPKSYNEPTFTKIVLQYLPQLKKIDIGDECFQCITTLTLEGLTELESIHIGSETASKVHEVTLLSTLL